MDDAVAVAAVEQVSDHVHADHSMKDLQRNLLVLAAAVDDAATAFLGCTTELHVDAVPVVVAVVVLDLVDDMRVQTSLL